MEPVVTYSKFNLKKDRVLVVIHVKTVTESPLEEGISANDLISLVPAEAGLPSIEEIKSLKTRVSTKGNDYIVLASVRYIGK